MNEKIPFIDMKALSQPYQTEIEEALLRVARSGRYIGGVENERFETALAESTQTEFAVGVSNGLDALRLIFRALIIKGDLKEGDEVIVPANTYIASILPLLEMGLAPVLAEPSELTLNLDTTRLEEYVSPKTRAILPVHLYGRAVWDKSLKEFVEKYNLLVVEDNAQAIGAQSLEPGLNGTRITGGLGHAGAFSFYPTKNIGALGDAGAVTTNDEELASIVRALSNYGSDRRYHNIYAGYNCRLDPMQAAVLNVKLKHLLEETASRCERAALYDRLITNASARKPLFAADGSMVWHQYVLRVNGREQFIAKLAEKGISTDIHYATPPHMQPCMAKIQHGPLPVTERIANEVVSLPITRSTSTEEIARVAEAINESL